MIVINHLKHYDHRKYWKYRTEVVNPNSRVPKLIRLKYLYYIKKCDAFNNSSMGTGFGIGAEFDTPPILPHLLNGIIIAYTAKIGKNCTILQNVTIDGSGGAATYIGDDCYIGAGAVILCGVKVGNRVKIGANAVVTKDVPDDCTVVGIPAHIVKKDGFSIHDN